MKVNFKNNNNELYISLTDIAKEYRLRYDKKYNVSQSVRSIPEKYIIKSRGAGSSIFLNVIVLDLFFKSKRNLPKDFIEDLDLELCKIKNLNYSYSQETFFIDMIEGFIKEIDKKIPIKRQYSCGGKIYDACIMDKILIEFNEHQHIYQKENDDDKKNIAQLNGFYLIIVDSKSNYGSEICRIYKKIKDVMY